MSESRSFGWRGSALIALPVLLGAFAPPLGTSTRCAQLAALTLPNVEIVAATSTPAGPSVVSGAPATAAPLTLPAFCRVAALGDADSGLGDQLRSVDSDHGDLERQVPGRRQWCLRGRHRLPRPWLRHCSAATRRRAPTRDIPAVICALAKGILSEIVDWANRSIDVMTQTAKLIVRDHAGRFPDRSVLHRLRDWRTSGADGSAAFPRRLRRHRRRQPGGLQIGNQPK